MKNGGFSITAYGFDNHSGFGTAHELFYKNVQPINGAVEMGLDCLRRYLYVVFLPNHLS